MIETLLGVRYMYTSLSSRSGRVAVICAGERRLNGPIPVRVHDLHNDSVRSTDCQERRDENQDDMQPVQGLPPQVTTPVISMVVDP